MTLNRLQWKLLHEPWDLASMLDGCLKDVPIITDNVGNIVCKLMADGNCVCSPWISETQDAKAVFYVQRPTGQLLKLTTNLGLWHAPLCRSCRVLSMDLRRGIFQCPWSFYHEDFFCADSFNQLKKDSAVALCLMLETENFFPEKNKSKTGAIVIFNELYTESPQGNI